MKKKVMIGEKEVLMEATGLTPVDYRTEFPGHDIITELVIIASESLENDVTSIDTGIYERLAYVMSEDHEKGVTFRDWIKQFGPMDVFLASEEIMDVWNGNSDTLSEPGEEEADETKNSEAAEN